MLLQILKTIFSRDLDRLSAEIAAYRSEADLWRVCGTVTNPGGNLCLHLIGNLNTYIGNGIGGTDYVRDRDAEFARKHVPRDELLRDIEATKSTVLSALDRLDGDSLDKEYPVLVFAEKTSTAFLLVHLATHQTYHLGQINYHRRTVGS